MSDPQVIEASGSTTPTTAPASDERRRIRHMVRAVVGRALERALRTPAGLAAVNRLHRALTLPQKRRFFYLCFDASCRVEGPWTVTFAGRHLVLPLRRDFELAWIAATGFHGYDTELHELYENLVRSPRPPRVVFDVGASYGLHSLKFLAHDVRVVSFEPNPACHAFFLACCRRNALQPDLRPLALAAAEGRGHLWVPDGQTWRGTTAAPVARSWGNDVEVQSQPVQQTTLDAVVKADRLVPDVIKIDTEGNELAVLAGARATLESARPLVVLESWSGSPERPRLFECLASLGYRLHALRFGTPPSAPLTAHAFVDSAASNFVARPGTAVP